MKGSIVDLNVRLEAAVRQEGEAWIASCSSLDVVTQEYTRATALEALKEAVQLWFESCIDRGVLDQALMEAGFDRTKPGERIDRFFPSKDYIEVSIPAYSAAQQ